MDLVPFPSFSSENLTIWFAQMESAFALNGVLEESDKYDYVLLNSPSDSLKIVEDILLSPPTEDKYEHIKYQFIKRMGIKKIGEVEFRNETPSEYLRKLKAIADERVSNEEIVDVWLNNMPEKIRQITRLATTGNLDTLGQIADKTVVLVTSPSHSTTSPGSQVKNELSYKECCKMMKCRMGQLARQLVEVIGKYEKDYEQLSSGETEEDDNQPSSRQQNSSKVQRRGRDRKLTTSSSLKVICWYHTKFGNKAIACVAPCQYKF